MGFLKTAGKIAGGAFGFVVGGGISLVGSLIDSTYITEIGEGVNSASTKAGETVGAFAGGVVNTAAGLAFSDSNLRNDGLKEMGDAFLDTASGVGRGAVHVWNNGKIVVEGVTQNDFSKIHAGGAELVKTVAIATFAIGVLDILDLPDSIDDSFAEISEAGSIDIADGISDDLDSSADNIVAGEVQVVENNNTHFVEPHTRILPSGESIWVDGDGDTSIDTHNGWEQTNPDFRIKA